MKKKGFDFVKRVIAVVIMAIVALTSIVSGLEKEDILLQKVDELKNYEIIYGDENGNIGLENQITKADFVKLIYTALDIPVIKQVSYGEYEEYAIMDGGEYPLETMRIKKREGI